MSYYLTDGAHVLISGATGAGDEYGGKSVLANWWFQESVDRGWHDLGVFFDPKGLGFVQGGDVRRVRTLKGLAESYRAGYRLFDYYPRSSGDELEDEHGRLVEMMRQLPGRKIMVHDEAQSYAGTDNELESCLSQYGNMSNSSEPTDDIRSLVVTQRAWNLPEILRANLPLKVWVGPMGNEARKFFQSEQMSRAGDKVEQATGRYRWSVTDGGDYVTTHEPVPGEYA